MSTECVFAG